MKCPTNNNYMIISYELSNHVFDNENLCPLNSGVFSYELSNIDGNSFTLVIKENENKKTLIDYSVDEFVDELTNLLLDGWSGYIVVLNTDDGELTGYSILPKLGEIATTPFIAIPDPTRMGEFEVTKIKEVEE